MQMLLCWHSGEASTQIRLAAGTVETLPAGTKQGEYDMVARLDECGAIPHFLDDAGPFVTGNERAGHRSPLAFEQADVAVTDAGGDQAHLHFPASGCIYPETSPG
jgi:hypothetical protein